MRRERLSSTNAAVLTNGVWTLVTDDGRPIKDSKARTAALLARLNTIGAAARQLVHERQGQRIAAFRCDRVFVILFAVGRVVR